MASLEALIKAKLPQASEDNLETGRLYSFAEGNTYSKFCKCACWCPTSNGTAIIEVWGAGGSGAKMCCCGNGLPGNSGSYSKTTKTMTPSDYMYGWQALHVVTQTHYVSEAVQNQQWFVW